MDRTVGPGDREIAQVLGGAETAGKDEGVEIVGADSSGIDNHAPGDAGRFLQNIAAFALGDLAGQVVDHMHLVAIRGETDRFRTDFVQGEQDENGFVNLGAVKDAAT